MRYAPPPVQYPAGRPVAGAAPGVLAGLACASACAAWAWQAPVFDWRLVAGAAVCALAIAWAFADWRAAPRGWLAWNGVHWHWRHRDAASVDSGAHGHGTSGESSLAGASVQVALHLDFQAVMLVRLQPAEPSTDGACPRWLWLERRQSPNAWADLRRAVLHAPRSPAIGTVMDSGAVKGRERAAP